MNYITKINKYLLEHYPLIWNTRLFWMILINIFAHLLFFIMGYFAVGSMEDLKLRYSLSDYFSGTSVIFYNYLISILMILVWVIYYLRNNAFKNFYKLQPLALFKEFCIIIFILFISATQYLSFEQGIQIKVKNLFSWEEIDQDIQTFNRTGVFLAQQDSDYDIQNKKYPTPFPLKVATENENNPVSKIDTTRAYFVYKGFRYQFFEIDKEYVKKYREENPYYYGYDYDFKHRIVKDVSQFKEHIDPTLLNYSKRLFQTGQDSLDLEKQIASHEQILTKGFSGDIESELKTMIALLNKYEVDHNLTVDAWLPMVDNPPLYHLEELIATVDPKKKNQFTSSGYSDIVMNETERYSMTLPRSEELYCDFERLDYFFGNVYSAHFPSSEMVFTFVILYVVFFFGLLLFIFKTTSLRSLLLSIVSAILLLVLIVMLMTYLSFYIDGYRTRSTYEYNAMIFMMGSIILLSVLSYLRNWRKIVSTILTSLAVYAVPLLVLFSALRYQNYLKDVYGDEYREGFIIWFDQNGFWFVLPFWLLAVFLYTLMIKELKARSE